MATVNASNARANLYGLIDSVAESHEPVVITGKRNNAVLISEEDWSAINETLHLISIPGMRDSIVSGMAASPRIAILNWIGECIRLILPNRQRRMPKKAAAAGYKRKIQQLLELISEDPSLILHHLNC